MDGLRDVIRCHLILLLALWVAIFAPMMCQYHGLMLRFGSGAMPMGSMAMMDMAEPLAPGSLAQDAGLSLLPAHEMASTVTMLMSFFVVALPIRRTVEVLSLSSPLQRLSVEFPLALVIPPPKQPPRLW